MEITAEKVPCRSLGVLAHTQFAKCREGALGDVTAVFQKGFYIRTKRDELVFVKHDGARSPTSLLVSEPINFRSKIHPGSTSSVSNECLKAGELEIDLANNELYYSDIRRIRKNGIPDSFTSNVLLASRVICTLSDEKCILGPESPAYHRIVSFSKFVEESDPDDRLGIMNELAGLLGLGFGFTPSGDDYVAGFVSAHNAISPSRSSMTLDWSSIVSRTSWISGKLVSYWQRGLVDEEFENFLWSLMRGSDLSVVSSTIDIASRGHTSGLDISVGAIMGLALSYDRVHCSNLRRRVFSAMTGIS